MKNDDSSETNFQSNVKEKRKQIKLRHDWVYECNNLKKRYDVIERQLQSVYRDGNPVSLAFKDIFDWNQLMHQERMQQKKHIQKHLTEISNLVNKFQHILTNMSSNEQFSEEMTSIAEQIEDKLMLFKTNHQQQLKELDTAENILWKELCVTTERLDTFQKDINANINTQNLSSKFAKKRILNKSNKFANDHDSRPQKLIDVQTQIDEHGRYGGWAQRDHDDFLKLYSQIPNDKELLHQLSEVMPQYTLSELREHLTWFDQYERLWEYKRKIINEWKEQQKQEKKIKSKNISKYEEMHKRKEKMRQKQLKLEQQQKRKMVKEWREQKEKEEIVEIKIKNDKLKQQKLKQKKLHKERVKEQKRLLLDLAERKKLNELVEKTTKPNKNLKLIKDTERNKELLIKFRTKDMLLVTKKKQAINKKYQKERDREWRLVNLIAKSQPNINVKTDKERLLKQTASTKKRNELKSKEKSTFNAKEKRLFGYTPNATRSVPTWRRGL
eukprot:228082_1